MAATFYEYSISGDFPAGKVAEDRLAEEIADSGITSATYTHTDTSDDDCLIWFDDPLSPGDETLLDGVVAVHSGDPLPFVDVVDGIVQSKGLRMVEGDAPEQAGDIRLVSGAIQIQDDTGAINPRTHVASHKSSHEPGGSDALAVDAAAGTGSLRTLGTGATSACSGSDSRLSDARAPTTHKSTHEPGGSDAMTVDAVVGTGSLRTLGTGAQQACPGNDTRLSDGRLPQNFQQVNDDGTSSTSSSAWQDKVTLTTPVGLPSGTYFVQFYAECKTSLTNNLVAVCCRHIDGDADEYLGAADYATAHDPSDAEHTFGGFKVISLTGGAHTFKIQYAQSKGSGTVSIRKARIALWRVA